MRAEVVVFGRTPTPGAVKTRLASTIGPVAAAEVYRAQFGSVGEGNQELAQKSFAYYGQVFADGALTAREKSLIALAVAHAVQCPYCIDAYSTESLRNGADLEQMTEALHVAVAIRGGASLVHGLQMLDHVKKSSM